jgi:hypothetical protein
MSGDDGWRFDIDEVGDDAEGDDETPSAGGDRSVGGEKARSAASDDGHAPRGEGVAGTTDADLDDPEPQPVTAENVFFVVLGAATMVGIVALLVV